MNKVSLGLSLCAVSAIFAVTFDATADPVAPLTLPVTVHLPDVAPLIPDCADPAADHFISLDIWQRPPPGATQVGVVHAWLTSDGIFHWPFVMRVRNLGDQPFVGKPGAQSAVVTEDDIVAKTKDRVVGSIKFDRLEPHGAALVHFEFTATRAAIEKQSFHRIYTLSLKLSGDQKALESMYGDCHPKNNDYHVEFDGSRKGWIFAN